MDNCHDEYAQRDGDVHVHADVFMCNSMRAGFHLTTWLQWDVSLQDVRMIDKDDREACASLFSFSEKLKHWKVIFRRSNHGL